MAGTRASRCRRRTPDSSNGPGAIGTGLRSSAPALWRACRLCSPHPAQRSARRELAPAQHSEELAARVGAEELVALDVERERVRALQRQLDARWLRRREEAVAHSSGRIFVPDDSRYTLFNNSVHELGR